ncbi:MAG: hypothetical protein PHV49_01135 [Alistipes sp.]|nr:hypothetical protein [Alistipes sp.]
MKPTTLLPILFSMMTICGYSQLPPYTATDGLGRVLPLQDEVGSPKADRHIAMFYFLWTGNGNISENQWDLDILHREHPEVFENFSSPYWGGGAGVAGRYYYWGEPLLGYYHGEDYWVHLKNIQLLTDAGVDMLVIDATNNSYYPTQSEALMKAMETVNRQGFKAPKIVFYTNTKSGERMQQIYNDLYKEEAKYRHPDCWFYLEGKPLIIGISAQAKGSDYEDFFTIRESQWPNETSKTNGWPWIEFIRPQKVYTNQKGEREIINVSVAQHPNPKAGMGGSAFYGNSDNWGRCYRNGSHGNPQQEIKYGYNFQEQWDYALTQNVPFVFVTGWNEWIAGKWNSRDENPEHTWFCDQANPEYSRDIEPTRTAGLDDHYYMQLVANIRRYKGIAATPLAPKKQTINKMSDWKKIPVLYTDYVGDVLHRNAPGAQTEPKIVYTNQTGRNDFAQIKVVRNQKNLYFYVKTNEAITSKEGDNWMVLYLDTDRKGETGWCGYDYKIISGDKLMRYTNNQWKQIGEVSCTVQGDEMSIAIPLQSLELQGQPLSFQFKWTDNMQTEDPLDWYVNGDAAPGGRFSYLYIEQ